MKNYYVDILVQQQISDLYGKISKKKKDILYRIEYIFRFVYEYKLFTTNNFFYIKY